MSTDTAATTIAVPSQALGAVEIATDSVITVCEPLAGFPDCRGYALVEHVKKDGRPSAEVAARFGLKRSDAVAHLQTLHCSDGRPHVLEERVIHLASVPAAAPFGAPCSKIV